MDVLNKISKVLSFLHLSEGSRVCLTSVAFVAGLVGFLVRPDWPHLAALAVVCLFYAHRRHVAGSGAAAEVKALSEKVARLSNRVG